MSTAPVASTTPTAPTAPSVVVSDHRADRIDHQRRGGERAVPYHCPFCAEEDLRPHGTAHGAWHCRTCLRVFSVRFLGLAEVQPSAEVAPSAAGAPAAADRAHTPATTPAPTPGGPR
jgi:ribosomal protein L37AE/L43A